MWQTVKALSIRELNRSWKELKFLGKRMRLFVVNSSTVTVAEDIWQMTVIRIPWPRDSNKISQHNFVAKKEITPKL